MELRSELPSSESCVQLFALKALPERHQCVLKATEDTCQRAVQATRELRLFKTRSDHIRIV